MYIFIVLFLLVIVFYLSSIIDQPSMWQILNINLYSWKTPSYIKYFVIAVKIQKYHTNVLQWNILQCMKLYHSYATYSHNTFLTNLVCAKYDIVSIRNILKLTKLLTNILQIYLLVTFFVVKICWRQLGMESQELKHEHNTRLIFY